MPLYTWYLLLSLFCTSLFSWNCQTPSHLRAFLTSSCDGLRTLDPTLDSTLDLHESIHASISGSILLSREAVPGCSLPTSELDWSLSYTLLLSPVPLFHHTEHNCNSLVIFEVLISVPTTKLQAKWGYMLHLHHFAWHCRVVRYYLNGANEGRRLNFWTADCWDVHLYRLIM